MADAIRPGLILLCLVFATTTYVSASGPEEPQHPPNVDSATWFDAHLGDVTHGSYQQQALLLPGPGDSVIPVLVREYDLFKEGEKKVQYVDGEGNLLWEEPLLVWTYNGHVLGDEQSHVSLTFDTAGFMGSVSSDGFRATYRMLAPNTPMGEDQVSPMLARFYGDAPPQWVGVPIPCVIRGVVESPVIQNCLDAVDGLSTFVPHHHTSTDLTPVNHRYIDVKPYADDYHTDEHGSSAGNTRITDAFNEQHAMWDNSLSPPIHQVILSITRNTSNYSTSSNCDTHLAAFRDATTHPSGAEAGQLFTGKNLSGCYGVAYVSNSGPGNPSINRDSLLEDADHSIWDYYDPDEDDDRGLVSAQEIAHNWGEPDHPQDKSGGFYNVMASGTDHDKRDFWFTSGSITRLDDGTSGF